MAAGVAAPTPTPTPAPQLKDRALVAASEALAYLDSQPQALIDSVFAVAVADGQLKDLVERASDPEERAALQKLEARAAAFVQERTAQLLETSDSDDAQLLLLARPHLWMGAGRYGSSSRLRAPPPPAESALTEFSLTSMLLQRWPSEPDSDACIRDLLDGCRVSARCWRVETSQVPPPRGYSLTHQLLFYSIAWRFGCDNATAFTGVDLGSRITGLCSHILEDASEIAAGGFPSYTRDLFTEQVLLCGLEGFQEFIRHDWLERILSWQRPFGCYGNLENDIQRRRRRKRTDMVGDYGCSMHYTGLAIAAVTVNLRYVTETM